MTKILNGSELASYIKQRQAHQVRGLRQAHGIHPKLAIVVTVDNPIIDVYVRLKKAYGADILVDVQVYKIKQTDTKTTLNKLSNDASIQGIIVQLPLENPADTEQVVNFVTPEKDVDALGKNAIFEQATPMAIMWLLAGYNVDLRGKSILIIGRGKLVGAPLEKLLRETGQNVTVADRSTSNLQGLALQADVIITAAGSPGMLTSEMIKQGAVVVDAGVASEDGKTVGDVAQEVYDRQDLTITPAKGGVGPLTVCALFENVIRACQRLAEQNNQL